MTAASLPELVLLALLGSLGVVIIVEDYRRLEIREIWLVAFALLALAHALVAPLPGVSSLAAIAGGLVAAAVTLLVGLAMQRRTGHQALGGADVYLAFGGGCLLGIGVIGAWILGFALLAGLAWRLAPRVAGLRPISLEATAHASDGGRSRGGKVDGRPDAEEDAEGDAEELAGDEDDGWVEVAVMPLCPAILVTCALLFALLRAGLLDPTDPLGLRHWLG